MKSITAKELQALRQQDAALQIIDVREAVEYQTEHVGDTQSFPLSRFEKSMDGVEKDKPVYVLCRTGSRAAQAANLLQNKGCENVFLIEGGLEALKSEGAPTIQGASRIWAMDRQVRLGAGTMVFLGILGHWFIHPGFLFLSVFVACGLIFSAISNTCGMALVLGKCPWNQIKN